MDLKNLKFEDKYDRNSLVIQPYTKRHRDAVEDILEKYTGKICKAEDHRGQNEIIKRILSKEIFSPHASIAAEYGEPMASGRLKGNRITNIWIPLEGEHAAKMLLSYLEEQAEVRGIKDVHAYSFLVGSLMDFYSENGYVKETIRNHPETEMYLPVMRMKKNLKF